MRKADFAARLDWCVKPFEEANHAPRSEKNKGSEKTTRAGSLVNLQAPVVSDPDKDELTCHWYFYPEEGTYTDVIPGLRAVGDKADFVAPEVAAPATLHVILEVTDKGASALTSYQRFIVSVQP